MMRCVEYCPCSSACAYPAYTPQSLGICVSIVFNSIIIFSNLRGKYHIVGTIGGHKFSRFGACS